MKFLISENRNRTKLAVMIIVTAIGMMVYIDGGTFGDSAPLRKNTSVNMAVPEGAVELHALILDSFENTNRIVTIISDDGIYESCVNLDSIMGQRGLKCSVAGAISIVKPHKKDWNLLLENGTIELISHSYNHIRMEDGKDIAEDDKALWHEIVDADKWYEDWLGYEQIVYVCPENQMCSKGYNILAQNGFWAVRRGYRGFNSLSPSEGTEAGQWFNLMVQGICDEDVDIDIRNGWVDTAINDGMWLIEMWHDVMPIDDGKYQTILTNDAEKHLDYIEEKAKNNEIWVATYSEAVKYIREKQNSKVVAYIYNSELNVYIDLEDENMSYDTFNQPLSIIISLPNDVKVLEDELVSCYVENGILINLKPGELFRLKLKEND